MERIAGVLAKIYAPMMWILFVVSGGLGILGVIAPGKLRGVVRAFTNNRTTRVLGLFLLIFGAEMFIRGAGTAFPMLVKSLGVILFIFGGACLFIPTLSVILAEWCVARSNNWYRVLGLVCIGLAILFWQAKSLPHGAEEQVPKAVGGVNLHYGP
jgi:hypothetical protein